MRPNNELSHLNMPIITFDLSKYLLDEGIVKKQTKDRIWGLIRFTIQIVILLVAARLIMGLEGCSCMKNPLGL